MRWSWPLGEVHRIDVGPGNLGSGEQSATGPAAEK